MSDVTLMAEEPTKSSHTPGPWLVNPDAARHEPGFYGTPSEPGEQEVYTAIQVGENVRLTAFIRPADAALIAAAPDLLALARRYASECANCGGKGQIVTRSGGSGWGNGGPDVCEEIEDCEDCADIWAVINKAKGRS